ncbi:hypothetical protein MJO28_010335 [Puccinia striiformis f. sp. tritici]|uniref:Uncharacterized protein n=1 Tax=Puccinia striiformis f. sp. tritici TaxID=168172 RepID=A0ACC0E471_9BASI|nr:hypothetical protein Pst134EB_020056 [Puccinia striiformis f. sp. tritici]KAI7944640.1 hypothetical protein MJO28_010335 [Puccinia striiformis f. sp. tritici]
MASHPRHMSARAPKKLRANLALNEEIGDFIGYLTLAVLCFVALLRFPSFIKYRLRANSRPASFKNKGYFLSSNRNNTTPSNVSKEAPPPASSSSLVKTKFTLSKLYNTKVPIIGSLISHFNLGNCVLFTVYLILLLVLATYKNIDGDISTTNYRRFGFIAVSQFPLMFALSMKNSPLNHITGIGYERLNFIHRAIGRVIFISAIIHGSLQMNLQMMFMGTIAFQGPTLYGIVSLCTLALLNLMGLRFVRNSLYQVFLVIHICGYVTLIAMLWLHADCARPFLKASIALLVLDNVLKIFKSKVKRATFTAMPGGLTRIEVQGINDGWRAGQHVFLRVLKGRQIFEKHPFTIANAPNSSTPYGSTDHLLLVAKAAGDFTKRVHHLAGQSQNSSSEEITLESKPTSPTEIKEEAKGYASTGQGSASATSYHVLIDGPYGSFFTDMTRYHTVVLFAGGSGFTYCMAALEDIIGQAAKSGTSLTKQVHVVWSLREPDMIASFGPGIEETTRVAEAHGITVTIRLFLTAANNNTLAERNYLSSVEFKTARPVFSEIMNEIVSGKDLSTGGGLGVGVCGPAGFVEGVSQAVIDLHADQVQTIGGVKLHTEKFGW